MSKIAKLTLVVFALVTAVSMAGLANTKEFKGDDYSVVIKDGKIIFTLTREGEKASIPGFLNDWKPDAPEAQMVKKDGKWVFEMDIEKFTEKKPFEFKFYVDGKWDDGGNKGLNLKKVDGEWVFTVAAGDKIKKNSNVSVDIQFGGRYTAWMPVEINMSNGTWNTAGDGMPYAGSKLDSANTMHNFDLDASYKLGASALGFTRLKMNYKKNGDRYMYLDQMYGSFFTDDVRLKPFFKSRDAELNFDNPTSSLTKFVDTAYSGIQFYKEKNSDLFDFGRNYAGMGLGVKSFMNLNFLAARRLNEYTAVQNDLIAARLKPVANKTMTVGLFWVYTANRDAVNSTFLTAQNGGRFVDPLRFNTAYGAVGSFGHEIGVDFSLALNDTLTPFAEAKLLRNKASVAGAWEGDIVGTGGVKLNLGSLLVEASANYMKLDARDDRLFVTGKGKLNLSGALKGWVAASFTMMSALETAQGTQSLFDQRLEGKVETDYFDAWILQSMRKVMIQQTATTVQTYNIMDVRLVVDWYFSPRLIMSFGARFFNDANPDGSHDYTALLPSVGVKYKFSDNIKLQLVYGWELAYDSYLEDNARTVEAVTGWAATGSNKNNEKMLAGMPRVVLKADVSF